MIYKRNRGFDILKGICIIIVVFCHTLYFPSIPNDFIRLWAQSIFLRDFFFIVGWLFVYKAHDNFSIKDEILNKLISLGIPYLFFSLISIIFNIIFMFFSNTHVNSNYNGINLILKDVYCLISLKGIGTLWFLPVLFISFSLFVIIIKKLMLNKKYKVFRCMIILVSNYIFIKILSVIEFTIGGSFEKFLYKEQLFLLRITEGIFYMIIGYIIAKIFTKYITSTKKTLIAAWLMLVIAWISFKNIEDLTIILLVVATPIMFNYIFLNEVLANKFKFIEYCGQKSLSIMIYHYLFVLPFVSKFIELCNSILAIELLNSKTILFILVMILTLVMVRLSERSKFIMFMLGNSKEFKDFRKKIIKRKKSDVL